MDTESAASQPTRPSANQLVAYNMAFYRKAAGMLQEELAVELRRRTAMPWSKVSVSAAERSWDGDRPKHFDATQLLAFADIFGVPITAFLLPPLEASTDNWRLRPTRDSHSNWKGREMGVPALLRCLYDVADDRGPTARAYQQRQSTAFKDHLAQEHVRPGGKLEQEKWMMVWRELARLLNDLNEVRPFLSQLPVEGRGKNDTLEDA